MVLGNLFWASLLEQVLGHQPQPFCVERDALPAYNLCCSVLFCFSVIVPGLYFFFQTPSQNALNGKGCTKIIDFIA